MLSMFLHFAQSLTPSHHSALAPLFLPEVDDLLTDPHASTLIPLRCSAQRPEWACQNGSRIIQVRRKPSNSHFIWRTSPHPNKDLLSPTWFVPPPLSLQSTLHYSPPCCSSSATWPPCWASNTPGITAVSGPLHLLLLNLGCSFSQIPTWLTPLLPPGLLLYTELCSASHFLATYLKLQSLLSTLPLLFPFPLK